MRYEIVTSNRMNILFFCLTVITGYMLTHSLLKILFFTSIFLLIFILDKYGNKELISHKFLFILDCIAVSAYGVYITLARYLNFVHITLLMVCICCFAYLILRLKNYYFYNSFTLIIIYSLLWKIKNYSLSEIIIINTFISAGLIYSYLGIKGDKKNKSNFNELTEYTVRHSINSVGLLDKDFNYIIVSDKYALDLGMKSNDIIGKHFETILPEQYNKFKVILNENTFRDSDVIREDFYTIDKNLCKHIQVSVSPLKNHSGNIEGYMLFNYILNSDEDYEKFKFLSFHDVLTGLYNRAFFEEEIRRLSNSRNLPLSIIMGDVNGLKLTNDAFGHSAGDEFLRTIAKILKSCCRDEDVVARTGGDEFSIILPKTNLEDAAKVCSRIKEKCTTSIDNKIQPSISLGLAAKYEASQSIDSVIKAAETMMYDNKFKEGKVIRESILESLKNYLNQKTSENNEHLNRVKKLSADLACRLGLSSKEIEELSNLAFLHDIGKVAVPYSILEKSDSLSNEEWKLIKNHCEIGYRIALTIAEIACIANYILYHHERWDGSGYPFGLKRDEIPKLSRIVSLVDAYDVMVHDRPYHKAMPKDKAIEEIRRCSGTQFDPQISEIFISMIYNSCEV